MTVISNPGGRRDSPAAPYAVRASGELALAELVAGPPCPLCDGSGRVVSVRENQVRMVARCRCQLIPDRIARFNRAGLPARHVFLGRDDEVDATGDVDSDEVVRAEGATKAYTEIDAWKRRFDDAYKENQTWPGLLLYGAVRRGKTHLLVGLVRWMVMDLGVDVRFVEFSRLLASLREGYDKGQSDRTLLNELVTVPVLAIDELGKGRLTDWELSVVDELVSRRYDAMACTLATTNYGPGLPTGRATLNLAEGARLAPSLVDRVGDRVYSRLRDMTEFIEVTGLDYRLLRDRDG